MSKLVRAGGLLALVCIAATCTPTDPKYAINYTEKRGVLEANGMRFVILPDPSTQLVEVDVRYGVGANEDPAGKHGLAHMVEHTMFQLRPDGDNSPPLFQFVQGLSTFMNAYTANDMTHYMTTARADNLEPILKIEAMRMFYGCKTVPEPEFIREREVVRNEIRGHGDADAQIQLLLLKDLYPKDHPYSHEPGGEDKMIAGLTLQDACDFIDKYYTPSNATVIIAGGVDYDKTVALVEKWFGKLPKKEAAPRKEVEPVQPNPGKQTFDLDIEQPIVTVSWPLPPSNTDEGRNARYGINQVFFRTASAAQKWDFADSVEPAILGGELAPTFSMIITLKSLDKLDEALDFVNKAAKSAHRGFADVTWQQFDNSRKVAKADFIEQMEELGGFTGRANQLADFMQFDKDVDFSAQGETYMIHELERYDHFDGDAIGREIKKDLDPDRARIDIFRPNKQGIKGDVRSSVTFTTRTDAEPEKAEVDPKEALHPIKMTSELSELDSAVRYKLSNGMSIVLLPTKGSMPIMSAALTFNVGDAQGSSPGEASAAAEFLNLPMDAEAMQATGVSVRGFADNDHTVFSSRAVNIYMDVVIRALEREIRAGDYDQEQIEQWQKDLKAQYKTQEAQAAAEYERQVDGAIYGEDHPYTKNTIVLPDSAGSIGYDQLAAFAKKHYTAKNATLVIAGNFDLDKAKSVISDAFGGWSSGDADQPIGPEMRQRTGPEYIGVVGRSSADLDITIAYPSAAGIDGEQAARMVLAGMISERMWDLRAKNALTYGLQSGRLANVGPSVYEMGGKVDGKRGGEAIKGMRDQLDALRTPSDQWNVDFVRARREIIQQLLGQSTVSRALTQRLLQIAWFGLKPNYYSTLLKLVGAVSPAEVKALIERELDPQKEIIVIQNDKATIEQSFKDAGITDVKIVEPSYK